MTTLGDKPAYPSDRLERGCVDLESDIVDPVMVSHPGMTLREHYAGLAMQGILASGPKALSEDAMPQMMATVGKFAVIAADALLSELERTR